MQEALRAGKESNCCQSKYERKPPRLLDVENFLWALRKTPGTTLCVSLCIETNHIKGLDRFFFEFKTGFPVQSKKYCPCHVNKFGGQRVLTAQKCWRSRPWSFSECLLPFLGRAAGGQVVACSPPPQSPSLPFTLSLACFLSHPGPPLRAHISSSSVLQNPFSLTPLIWK